MVKQGDFHPLPNRPGISSSLTVIHLSVGQSARPAHSLTVCTSQIRSHSFLSYYVPSGSQAAELNSRMLLELGAMKYTIHHISIKLITVPQRMIPYRNSKEQLI